MPRIELRRPLFNTEITVILRTAVRLQQIIVAIGYVARIRVMQIEAQIFGKSFTERSLE
jgi:hypothetical protein